MPTYAVVVKLRSGKWAQHSDTVQSAPTLEAYLSQVSSMTDWLTRSHDTWRVEMFPDNEALPSTVVYDPAQGGYLAGWVRK